MYTTGARPQFFAPFKFAPSVLEGLEYNDEDFLEYLDEPLSTLVVRSSGIKLTRNEINGVLVAVTDFETARELSEQELGALKADYDAQMCDGIGENLLSEIKNRPDVKFRLEVFGLYDDSKASQLRIMT